MKVPKALREQLSGLQEEIDIRQRQAQLETAAAYSLLLFLCEENPRHEELYSEDEKYRNAYTLIDTRYRELPKEGDVFR